MTPWEIEVTQRNNQEVILRLVNTQTGEIRQLKLTLKRLAMLLDMLNEFWEEL